MSRKPQDLLEFYRRASDPESPEAEESGAAPTGAVAQLEKTARILVIRRSQAIVAGVAAGVAVILAFVLGLAFGGTSADAAPALGPWVIKVRDYRDNDAGQRRAKSVMSQIQKLGLGEVSLQTMKAEKRLAVTLGAWIRRPDNDAKARDLLEKVRELTDSRNDRRPFERAGFWQIKR